MSRAMVETTIRLPSPLLAAVRQIAAREARTMGDILREAVREYVRRAGQPSGREEA